MTLAVSDERATHVAYVKNGPAGMHRRSGISGRAVSAKVGRQSFSFFLCLFRISFAALFLKFVRPIPIPCWHIVRPRAPYEPYQGPRNWRTRGHVPQRNLQALTALHNCTRHPLNYRHLTHQVEASNQSCPKVLKAFVAVAYVWSEKKKRKFGA